MSKTQWLRRGNVRWLALYALTAVGLMIALTFLWSYVGELAESYQDRRTQQEQLKNLNKLIEEIAAVSEREKPFIAQLELPFPLASATPQIIERVEQLGENLGLQVQIDSIVEGTQKKSSRLRPFTMNFQVRGSAEQLLRFLAAFERVQEFSVIDNLNLRAGSGGAAGQPASYGLIVKATFYLQSASNE